MLKLVKYYAFGALLGLSAVTTLAADLSDHPGYLNLDELDFLTGREPNVEVNLYGPVLKMLTQLPIQYGEQGDQVVELLKVIDQVLVRIYQATPDEARSTLTMISQTSDQLEKDNWVRIVRVREENDADVDIHVKMSDDGENLNGLVIMAVEHNNNNKDETNMVFVNIAGNFNPAYLANLGNQFNLDYLNQLDIP